MGEQYLWILIYGGLGLACYLLAARVKRLREELRALTEEKDKEKTSPGENGD